MHSTVLVAALAFSFSQVLLSVTLLCRSAHRWTIREHLYLALLFAVSGYLLTPLATDSGWRQVMSIVQTLVPGVFWLFSSSLFDDHFRLRPWKIALIAITVVVPFTGSLLNPETFEATRWLFYGVPQGLEFVLMTFALSAMVRTWREDLVQSRRTLRMWFCGFTGVYIMSLLLVREVFFSEAEWLPVWQYVPLGVLLLIINALVLDYRDSIFHSRGSAQPSAMEESHVVLEHDALEEPQAVSQKTEEDVPEEVVTELKRLMEEEAVYREMGLTIGQLSSKIELPEYRLRKIINAGLGYRNFSDFLNTYRIKETSQRLSAPEEVETPVLNIALDAGYRSLSSFNKAFKETLQQTPTEFRNAAIEDRGLKYEN